MARLNRIALIIAISVLMCVLAEEMYSTQYDNVDIQAMLQNDELRDKYNKCFMEIIPCETPEQKYLTDMFSEAYQTKCKKCTEKQKEMLKAVVEWYQKNDPAKWKSIVAKIEENMKKKVNR